MLKKMRFEMYLWNATYFAIRAHQGHSVSGIGRNLRPDAVGQALLQHWTECPFLCHLTRRNLGAEIAAVGLRPGGVLDNETGGARFHSYCAGRNPYGHESARQADHPWITLYEKEIRGPKTSEMVIISTLLLFELPPTTKVCSTKTHAFLLDGPVPPECVLQVHALAKDPWDHPRVLVS